MKHARYLLLLLVLLGADSPPPPRGGTIEGSVVAVMLGTGPSKAVPHKNVFVYLESVDRKPNRGRNPGAGRKYEIRQIKEEFVPRVLVVPLGAEVAFPNYDKQVHNVFSPTEPAFDLGRYNTDKHGKSEVFEDVDEFDIFCDMHRKMSAKVKVVDSAYIVRAVDGKFVFTNVPAGRYKVAAWVPNSKEDVRSGIVVVSDGGTIKLERALNVQFTRQACHVRKDNTAYPSKDYNRCPADYY